MAVDWATFLVSVIGGAGAALLVVAFLGRILVRHMLDREQKKFQADLDSRRAEFEARLRQQAALELEHVRGVVDRARADHEIMLTRLQDTRARVIGSLYTKLVLAKQRTHTYVMDSTTDAKSERVDRLADAAWKSLEAAALYFANRAVWLPKDIAEKVEAFNRQIYNLQVVRKTFSPARRGPENFELVQDDELTKAWNDVNETIPNTLAALTDELRALLDPRLLKVPSN